MITLVVTLLFLSNVLAERQRSYSQPSWDDYPEDDFLNPFVILSVNQSRGDFGPFTPGTQTDGWQEALQFCVENNRDLYVEGGYKGPVFNLHTTLFFPPAQDFRINCDREFVLNYAGDLNNPAVVMDSCMNCQINLGTHQRALHIQVITIDQVALLFDMWIANLQ